MVVLYLVLSVFVIIFLTARLKVHPFIALLVVALVYGFLSGMPSAEIVKSVNEGFGNTLGGIGLIIILGVIIGAFLENSGGAYAIAEKVLKIIGKDKVPSSSIHITDTYFFGFFSFSNSTSLFNLFL